VLIATNSDKIYLRTYFVHHVIS